MGIVFGTTAFGRVDIGIGRPLSCPLTPSSDHLIARRGFGSNRRRYRRTRRGPLTAAAVLSSDGHWPQALARYPDTWPYVPGLNAQRGCQLLLYAHGRTRQAVCVCADSYSSEPEGDRQYHGAPYEKRHEQANGECQAPADAAGVIHVPPGRVQTLNPRAVEHLARYHR